MKILIFTEGTILMHSSAKGLSREKIVKQSKIAGIQREAKTLVYKLKIKLPQLPKGAVYDFVSYIPIGNSNHKLIAWSEQGAQIYYLSSRRIKSELDAISAILNKYNFPQTNHFFFRKQGEDYKDVAERLQPDILIEDDCESIGGEKEMTITSIKPEIKRKIKSVIIKEFSGIDHLPDDINELKKF